MNKLPCNFRMLLPPPTPDLNSRHHQTSNIWSLMLLYKRSLSNRSSIYDGGDRFFCDFIVDLVWRRSGQWQIDHQAPDLSLYSSSVLLFVTLSPCLSTLSFVSSLVKYLLFHFGMAQNGILSSAVSSEVNHRTRNRSIVGTCGSKIRNKTKQNIN